jgi:hypothetical protein
LLQGQCCGSTQVQPRGDLEAWRSGQPAVFWRLVANRAPVAIGVSAACDREATLLEVDRVRGRAAELRVSLGYRPADPTPTWLAHDEHAPRLIGLPGSQLVATFDASQNLATALRESVLQEYVHRAGE